MKYIVLALFAAVAFAAPAPDNGEPVELIVNGVPEGQPLDIEDIVDIKVKEHANGVVVSNTDLLYPLSSVGIAEAAIAQIIAEEAAVPVAIVESAPQPEQMVGVQVVEDTNAPTFVEVPSENENEVEKPLAIEPIVLPTPVLPEVVPPSPIVLPAPEPAPVAPELEPSVPEPAPSLPEPVPSAPEQLEPIPEPAAQVPGEVYNDGLVQVQVNAPEEASVLSTIQSWFSLVVNYISNGIQTTQNVI